MKLLRVEITTVDDAKNKFRLREDMRDEERVDGETNGIYVL